MHYSVYGLYCGIKLLLPGIAWYKPISFLLHNVSYNPPIINSNQLINLYHFRLAVVEGQDLKLAFLF